MDRTGADFYNVIDKMREQAESQRGRHPDSDRFAEENFRGSVDLITMKAQDF
jgi:translation elongation factor EF-G